MAGNVELLRTFLSEEACVLASLKYPWQNVEELPAKAFRSNQLIELANHLGIILLGLWVYWQHA